MLADSPLVRPLTDWWDGLTDAHRVQWTAVAATVLLFGCHAILWSEWLIEDAAITYSYARNAAVGEGWVVYAGGEPVEGFSNPTWTALLAALRFVGISPWISGSLLGLVFGALSLPLAFLWARRITGSDGLLPAFAPLWLACSPQFVLWCMSGLENALWIWLMAVGSLAFLRELDRGGPPWSALPMGLLAITRPEGPLYVAAMALVGVGLSLRRPRALARLVAFVGISAGIWAAYLGFRYAVFGWPLPNTYYAKLSDGQEHFFPWLWTTTNGNTGWYYLRSWALWSAWGFLLPLLPVAATGWKGWRGQLGLFLGAVLALLLLPGAEWLTGQPWWPLAAEPLSLVKLRVLLLFAVGLLLPWVRATEPSAAPRILAWTLATTMFGFTLYVGGDWMDAHRWISLAVVPLAVALADLLHTLSLARPWSDPVRARQWIAVGLGGIPLVAGVVHSVVLVGQQDISPFKVGRRAAYINHAQRRLHLDHPLTYDIDMGAIMWWSDDRLLDAAGLVDVPMARHTYQDAFIREYLLREQQPHFMHAHSTWLTRVGLDRQPTFARDYLKLPDYVDGPGFTHDGNHVRRDTFARKRWAHEPDPVRFADRVLLEGVFTPATTLQPGGIAYVEVGWRRLAPGVRPFRALAVLSQGERVHSWELPPAYDWLPPSDWRPHEVVHGFHSLDLPRDLPVGDWDLSIVLLGRDGVWPADRSAPSPALARGEVRWEARFTVASPAQVRSAIEGQLSQLATHAAADQCPEAVESLQVARRHLPEAHPDQPWADPAHHTTLARCWARVATTIDARSAEEAIAQARLWDHHDPQVQAVGQQLANSWEAEGDAAWANGQAGPAFTAWRRALAADPNRPFVRKRLEQARDARLGLVPSAP